MVIGNGIHEKIRMGSTYFFSSYKDFEPHDNDFLILVDEPIFFKIMLQIKGEGKDLLYWKKMRKEEFIETMLRRNFPMEAGKFLIPEFCKKIDFNVDDLKQLDILFNNMDDKHKYEKIIYEAYLKNGDFILNEEQRLAAYEEYKKYRT